MIRLHGSMAFTITDSLLFAVPGTLLHEQPVLYAAFRLMDFILSLVLIIAGIQRPPNLTGYTIPVRSDGYPSRM